MQNTPNKLRECCHRTDKNAIRMGKNAQNQDVTEIGQTLIRMPRVTPIAYRTHLLKAIHILNFGVESMQTRV